MEPVRASRTATWPDAFERSDTTSQRPVASRSGYEMSEPNVTAVRHTDAPVRRSNASMTPRVSLANPRPSDPTRIGYMVDPASVTTGPTCARGWVEPYE